MTTDLPITDVLSQITQLAVRAEAAVVKAPPGAGKTTGVPPALLAAGMADDGQIVLVQPRRLAARAAASRLARLVGGEVGQTVGYHVRFDRQASAETRLLAVTTGVLLRRLQGDPLLDGVSCVILDEFHERSLELDLALGMLQRVRTTLRPELRLLVMSATLDPDPIVRFLGQASGVVSEGRSFPVDVRYAREVSRQPLPDQVAKLLPTALRETDGDLLVFLPGVGEIRRTRQAIERAGLAPEATICELYGDLPPQAQDAVVSPAEQRKIVLATNVAETSVTIPGVTGVIDSGLARVMQFDPHVGLPRLQLQPISQASAEQRAGRAGRTAPGLCWRLWPEAMHRARPELDAPEILRGDFVPAALTLLAWGERDLGDFPWLTTPRDEAVDRAVTLLRRLGAIDEARTLTPIGRQMSRLPVHPRLARLLVEARTLDVVRRAAVAAALLTERDPFRGPRSKAGTVEGRQDGLPASGNVLCDLDQRLEQLDRFAAGDESSVAAPAAAKQVLRVAKQLARETEKLDAPEESAEPPAGGDATSERLRRALLTAYPDRVARRRDARSERGMMVGGRGIRQHPQSQVREGELLLCIDVDDAKAGPETTVRLASQIDPAWLPESSLREADEPFFHPSRKAVVMRRRRYFEDLLLEESPVPCPPSDQTAAILYEHALRYWEQVFPADQKDLTGFIERARFLDAHAPELGLPAIDEATLREVLAELCQRRTSFAELREAPWSAHLQGKFDYEALQRLEAEAPTRIRVPSGNSFAVRYESGQPPRVEVRLQELFGWTETPRIAGGRVPIQLHLLGPNFRPQQITDDLASFWQNTYHEVRKELRRRYPKHHWPEDPLTATATRNSLKPRKL